MGYADFLERGNVRVEFSQFHKAVEKLAEKKLRLLKKTVFFRLLI
jgi:hypothetical protein